MNSDDPIDREAIAATERRIRPHIRRTPVIEVDGADFGLSTVHLRFKLELLQHAGSFKTRGAFANLLMRDIPRAGVAAASGGNHGAAVAYAALKLGVPAKIFVPSISSPAKIQRIRDYGAELVVGGDRYDDALAAAEAWSAQSGALAIHAFDQRETLLGQGTVGLEIEQQVDDLDTLLVAVGGGGLIGGIAAWYGRRIRVIGVEPEASPTLTKAILAGRPVDAEAGGIAAEFVGAAPRRQTCFPDCRAPDGARRSGPRRGHSPRPESALGGAQGGRRAGRGGSPRGIAVRSLRTPARRTHRGAAERRQYGRG